MCTPGEQSQALVQTCAPVFVQKKIDTRAADLSLDKWLRPFDFTDAAPPEVSDYQAYINEVLHSAARPDMKPYCALKYTGVHGARTLKAVGDELAAGIASPIPFNDNEKMFVPKGDEPEDFVDCS